MSTSTFNPWDAVQRRLRDRRDRLEGPAPAHEMLLAREGEDAFAWDYRVSSSGPLGESVLAAMHLAEALEEHARADGSPWARQQADEALSTALRLAARLVAQEKQ
jgi:hypothetical protein